MGKLDPRAAKRVSGNAWDDLRDLFHGVSDTLLGVSDSAYGQLITIYVKYIASREPAAPANYRAFRLLIVYSSLRGTLFGWIL